MVKAYTSYPDGVTDNDLIVIVCIRNCCCDKIQIARLRDIRM